MADATTTTAPAAAPGPRANAVRTSVAGLLDQIGAAIASGDYPDGIPADLQQISQTAAFKAKALRATVTASTPAAS